MSYETEKYNTNGIHPVRVYAAGDLAIAYILNPDNPERVSARGVCWPKEKIYSGSLYGASERLRVVLHRAGFTEGEIGGARLLLKKLRDGAYVCPYIDGYDSVGMSEDKKHLIVGGCRYNIYGDSGIAADEDPECWEDDDDRDECPQCGVRFYDGCTVNREIGCQTWCQSCADNEAFLCDATGLLYDNNVGHVDVPDVGRVAAPWFDRQGGYFCQGREEYLVPHIHGPSVDLPDGRVVSQKWLDKNPQLPFAEAAPKPTNKIAL